MCTLYTIFIGQGGPNEKVNDDILEHVCILNNVLYFYLMLLYYRYALCLMALLFYTYTYYYLYTIWTGYR